MLNFVTTTSRAAFALATLVPFFVSGHTLAQGTGGNFPVPRSGPTVAAWLEVVSADASPSSAVWALHEKYLEQAAALRDGEIEAWLTEGQGLSTPFAGDDPEAAVRRAKARASAQRRLVERLGQMEANFWNEVAAELGLDADRLAVLQARGSRDRALDLRMRANFMGASEPVDLLEILAKLDATPEEAAAIRAALADHDQRLNEALRKAMDEELDRSVKIAESIAARQAANDEFQAAFAAELEAAAEEGREPVAIAPDLDPRLDPMMGAMLVGSSSQAIREQQLDSFMRLAGLVSDERLNGLLVTLRLVPGDGMTTFFRNSIEPRIASGTISAEQAAEVDSIRADHFRERVRLGLEYAREEVRSEEMFAMAFAPGEAPPAVAERRVDVLRRELTSTLPERTRERLAGVVDMESVAKSGAMVGRTGRGRAAPDGGVSIQIGEAIPAQGIAFTAVSVVSTLEVGEGAPIEMSVNGGPIAISFTTEGGMTFVAGGGAAAPPFRAMDERRLATMLADAQVDMTLRDIAEQIRRDAAESFDAIVRDLEAALQAEAERRRQANGVSIELFMVGATDASLPEIDAALRRCLDADRVMFESLEAVVGSESAETLAMWRDARATELVSIAAGLRGRSAELSFSPWQGKHASIDTLDLALETVPEAMRDAGVRAAAARQLREQRQAVEAYWAEQQAIRPALRAARDAVFNRPPPEPGAIVDPVGAGEAALARHQELAKAEGRREQADRRVRDAIRSGLDRFEQAMPPEAGRSFHAAVRRAAWPDVVPSMPALDGMNAAMRIVAADEQAMARLAEIEEAYLAESEALFESLDGLAPAQPRRGEGGDGPGGFSPEEMKRWESISGRLRFRHRELDYGAVRSLRELVGPEQASRIEWSEGRSRPSATFSFIGG